MTTLSFAESLFARGLNLEKLGFLAGACKVYQKLLHTRPLTRDLVGKAAGRLGKLQLQQGQHDSARRNLTLAAARFPRNAEYQHLLARAIEEDDLGDFHQAEQRYRNAVNLQPEKPTYLLDLARHLAQRGQDEEAASLIRQALHSGEDDLKVVGMAAAGLREMGEFDEASALLRRAQFRHAGDSGFRQLWNEHQFQALWAKQQQTSAASENSRILRFVPQVRQVAGSAG